MSDEDIKAFMVRMDERWERVEEDLDKLKHVLLEGNGSPAMTVQVALQEQRLRSLEESKKDEKVPRSVWVGLLITSILSIGAILAGFAQG
jgi:hypothetical protein